MKDETRKRHFAKAVTWRILGTLDTVILAWAISGNSVTGIQIGGIDFFTKIIFYYLHERIWFKVNISRWGIHSDRARHLAKTVSWRVMGTTETILLSYLITGNYTTGLQIGIAEIITKMALYYLHERAWFKINFGLKERGKQH